MQYAIDAILEFSQQQHQQTNEVWISVEEKLPQHNNNVLMYNGKDNIAIGIKEYTQKFIIDVDCESWDKATHWMPLPNPPKQ